MEGKKFWKWIVLSEVKERDKKGQVFWNCRCVCGFEKKITGNNLKFGTSKGCARCNRKRIPRSRPSNLELFKKTTRSQSGCWDWTGSLNGAGYATEFFKTESKKSLNQTLSRIVIENKIGRPLLRSEFACHRCDNPKCIRPSHLFLGSPKDNVLDAVSKGRMDFQKSDWVLPFKISRGEKSYTAKSKVILIRKSKLTQRALGAIFKVGRSTIGYIQARKSWKHVP